MKIFLFHKQDGLLLAVCALAATVLTICCLAGRQARSVTAAARRLPVYRVRTEKKVIALTFDAAWGNEDTQQLIDALSKYHAKATFFLVGAWVEKYPDSVAALAAAGYEIGNHSDTHPHFANLSKEKMRENILSCNEKIYSLIGRMPSAFRAPYGEYSNNLIDTMDEVGMSCIQWDVDSLDWKGISADEIYKRVTSKVKPGSIVLFHNAAKHTPEALPRILEALQKEGYSFVSVSELIYPSGSPIDSRGEQYLPLAKSS